MCLHANWKSNCAFVLKEEAFYTLTPKSRIAKIMSAQRIAYCNTN